MSRLRISIDFDETFTRDPELWADFIKMALSRDHRVTMITARRATEENSDLINAMLDEYKCQLPIIYTS